MVSTYTAYSEVVAVMNSHVSNVDDLQTDDINGATAIYGGSSTPSPAPAPRSNRAPTVTAPRWITSA